MNLIWCCALIGASVHAIRMHLSQAPDCDSIIPRYDMKEWKDAHGDKLPDHPAVFLGHSVNPGSEKYEDLSAFLADFGNYSLDFVPEYGAAGGFGAHFWNH